MRSNLEAMLFFVCVVQRPCMNRLSVTHNIYIYIVYLVYICIIYMYIYIPSGLYIVYHPPPPHPTSELIVKRTGVATQEWDYLTTGVIFVKRDLGL